MRIILVGVFNIIENTDKNVGFVADFFSSGKACLDDKKINL